jgi:hypothetical protein
MAPFVAGLLAEWDHRREPHFAGLTRYVNGVATRAKWDPAFAGMMSKRRGQVQGTFNV